MSGCNFRMAQAVLCGVLLVVTTVTACARARRPAAPRAWTPRHAVHTLVPAPLSIDSSARNVFAVTAGTSIRVSPPGDTRAMQIARHLADLISLAPEIVIAVEPSDGVAAKGSIHLVITPRATARGPESYDLTITSDAITLSAGGPAGLFYGVQTIRQLLPPVVEYEAARPVPLTLAVGHVVDSPRFSWRGSMLDVSRHFFSVDDVKRYIDLLAMMKMNRLHLHLADDQGWRIEIKSWPNLARHGGSTEVGGGPGGFYTQEQYAELVAYADARFVTIVPEIDMPGHTNAALSSYPELNCDGAAPPLYTGIEVGFSALCVDKETTYRFIEDVVREIAALTTGPYFHIGGDEVKKLTDEQYRRFIDRAQRIVQSSGKEVIGWDEIAPAPLLATTIVQHWRQKASLVQAVRKQARFIMSPAHKAYLDMKYHRQTPIGLDWAAVIDVRDAYEWDPASLVEGVPEQAILGVEAPIWSETLATIHDVEFLAFPRMAALAEIGWSSAERRDWSGFRRRLGEQAPRWAALGINFYRSPQVEWKD